MLKLQGDFKDDESLKKLFRNMDKDGDGKISFQEAEVFEGEAIDGDSRSLLVINVCMFVCVCACVV